MRILYVGGAGTSNVGDAGRVIDQLWFPETWKLIAQAHVDALELLRNSDVIWTLLTPPTYFEVGERTGVFRFGTNELVSGPEKDQYLILIYIHSANSG